MSDCSSNAFKVPQKPEPKPCPFCGGEYRNIKDHSQNCYLKLVVDNFRAFATDDITFQHTENEMDRAWNTRYEPTCQMFPDEDYDFVTCSACGYEEERNLIYPADSLQEFDGRYCPNCGARVVD